MDNKESKLILRKKRKNAIKKMSLIGRIGVYLWIYKVWYIERDVKGRYFECNQFNAYNPLFWVFMVFILLYGALQGILLISKDVRKMCRVSKWG